MCLYFLLSVSGIRPTVEYVVPGGDVTVVHALTLSCGVLMCFYEGMLLKANLFSPAVVESVCSYRDCENKFHSEELAAGCGVL